MDLDEILAAFLSPLVSLIELLHTNFCLVELASNPLGNLVHVGN